MPNAALIFGRMRQVLATRVFWRDALVSGVVFGAIVVLASGDIGKAIADGIAFGPLFSLALILWPSLRHRQPR